MLANNQNAVRVSGMNSYFITASDSSDSITVKCIGANPSEALANFFKTFNDLAGATITIREEK